MMPDSDPEGCSIVFFCNTCLMIRVISNTVLLCTLLKKAVEVYKYYRVIALIPVDIVLSWDIEGRELESIHRYPNQGRYSPMSVR